MTTLKTEHNVETGEVIIRQLTQEESIALSEQLTSSNAEYESAQASKAAVATNKERARAKLAALGLTEDEITAMVGA